MWHIIRKVMIPLLILGLLLGLAGCSGTSAAVNAAYNEADDAKGPSSNLPIVIIDTGGKAINQNELIPAEMKIVNNGYGRRNYVTDIPELQNKIGIKVRGQSSAGFPKKQYKFETWDEDKQDMDVSILGLPKDSDWILYGPYADKSLIRNYLVYELGRKIMYAPKTVFVEVYLKNNHTGEISETDYLGVYLIVENIKRGKNRVDIQQLDPDADMEPDITGGYIIALDKTKPGDTYFDTQRGNRITYVYPRGDIITPGQKSWIKDYVNEFETVLHGDQFKDNEAGYARYIDVDSFIDCILINELFKNVDGFRISTYYYKDKGKKLAAGPLWDFNLSAGNVDYNTGFDPHGWYILKEVWVQRLVQDPAFIEKMSSRWQELRQYILSTENINAIIDYAVQLLSEAQVRNFKRWTVYGGGYIWPNPQPYTRDYLEEINRMKDFLTRRALWIDTNIDELKD